MASPLLDQLSAWGCRETLGLSGTALYESRLAFLDTLACMLVGTAEPSTLKIARVLQVQGLPGPAATFLPGLSLDASKATLFNGFCAHVLDFDDYEAPASTHPSAVLVPALLALSDLRDVTLGQLCAAYAVGYEAINRIGRSLGGYAHYAQGWHATATLGPLGAAAATARLLGLSQQAFQTALAMATSSSAGLKLQFGSDTKPLHAGQAARNGLEAGLLAEAGLTAKPGVMEGPFGFLARYGDPRRIADLEASPPAIASVPILRKPWPSCAYTHRSVEAALALAGRPGFAPDRIASGRIEIPEPYYRVASYGLPKSAAEARFSLPYCVAVALSERSLLPLHFSEDFLGRQSLLDLAARIEVCAYDPGPGLEDMSPAHPDTLSLAFTDDSPASVSIGHVRGGARKPLCADDLLQKWVDCGGARSLGERLLAATDREVWRFASWVAALRETA